MLNIMSCSAICSAICSVVYAMPVSVNQFSKGCFMSYDCVWEILYMFRNQVHDQHSSECEEILQLQGWPVAKVEGHWRWRIVPVCNSRGHDAVFSHNTIVKGALFMEPKPRSNKQENGADYGARLFLWGLCHFILKVKWISKGDVWTERRGGVGEAEFLIWLLLKICSSLYMRWA